DSEGAEALEALINLQESLAQNATALAHLLNVPVVEVQKDLKDGRFVKLSMGDEVGFTTTGKWEALKRFTANAVKEHHEAEPLSPGLEMESIRTRLPYEVSARVFREIVDRVARETEVVREEGLLRLRDHKVQLGGDAERLSREVDHALTRAGFQPPDLKQFMEEAKLPPSVLPRLRTVLSAMEREGRVVKIATDLYFARNAVDAARERLVAHLSSNSEITAATYRDLLGASRKFAIALLDYFDRSGLTTRVGDARRLRA